MDEALPPHVTRNRAYWDGMADDWVASGERNWQSEPVWGIWRVPDETLHILPDVRDKDAIELGCGTGYVSSWMARRGARVVGIDNSARQLDTARRLQKVHNIHFDLIYGNAEDVPLPDASFDVAISEYGAAIWCDPSVWIPEASRLLRPGGRLVFLGNSPLNMVCIPNDDLKPASTLLIRPYFGMHRFEWSDGGVEFHLPHGRMIRLLRECGFDIVDLIEIQAPDGPDGTEFQIARSWARKWPAEEAWIADKR